MECPPVQDLTWGHFGWESTIGNRINGARTGTSGCVGLEMRLEWRITSIGQSFFGDDKNVLNSDCSDS